MPDSVNAPRTRIVRKDDHSLMPQFSLDGLNWHDVLLHPCWDIRAARLAAQAWMAPALRPPTRGITVE